MRAIRGFTLTEILVSLVVISVGLLALSTVALMGFNEFQFTRGKLLAQGEAMRLQYLLTSYFGQAVKVGNGNPQTAVNTGGVLQFNYDEMADAATPVTLIASFQRDAGGRGAALANIIGDYRQTGIWWVRPTPTTSGVVVIDGDPAGTSGNITPDYGDQYIGRLTELQFQRELGGLGNARLAAINVRAVFRYYRPGVPAIWCPQTDIANAVAGCVNSRFSYVDVTRSFRISLRDNILNDDSQTGGSIAERPLGLVYFFNPIIPVTWGL